MIIKAPWTPEQVDALNAFQRSGAFHPFTCANNHGAEDTPLFATQTGWICPLCNYTQDWAHDSMADPSLLLRQARSSASDEFYPVDIDVVSPTHALRILGALIDKLGLTLQQRGYSDTFREYRFVEGSPKPTPSPYDLTAIKNLTGKDKNHG